MLFPRLVLLAPRSIDVDAVVCRPLLGQRSRFQGGDVPAIAVATGRSNGRFDDGRKLALPKLSSLQVAGREVAPKLRGELAPVLAGDVDRP
jgi:hypothetical protein